MGKLTTSLTAVRLKQSDAQEKAWSHSKLNYAKGVFTVIQINAPKEIKVHNGMKKHKITICNQIFSLVFIIVFIVVHNVLIVYNKVRVNQTPEQLASHSTCPAINPPLSQSVNHVTKNSFNQAVCLSVSQDLKTRYFQLKKLLPPILKRVDPSSFPAMLLATQM